MSTCCVTGCTEEGGNVFPSDISLRRKWMEALGELDPATSPTDGVVCDHHFCDQDFLIIKGSDYDIVQKIIQPTAIPILHLHPHEKALSVKEEPYAAYTYVDTFLGGELDAETPGDVPDTYLATTDKLLSKAPQNLRIHSGKKSYMCEECGTCFTRSSHLKRHMRNQSGVKPYKCEQCGVNFTQQASLKTHMRIHSGEKPYMCEQCGTSSNLQSSLKTHMRTHSGEKPYSCEQCGTSFTQKSNLKTHMRIHSGEKPYKCNVCGVSFTRQANLKTHVRIHSGEKPYTCEQCGTSFTHQDHLKTHMGIHSGAKLCKTVQM